MTSEDTTNKPTAKLLVKPEKAVKIGKALAALPPKQKMHMTAYEVVAANKAEFVAAQQDGYWFIDIAKILNDEVVKISASTLAHYMRALDAKSKLSRIAKPKAAEPATSAVPVSPTTKPTTVTPIVDTPT